MRAEKNKLRLLKAPAIIAKLAARSELQKNHTTKLRTFVVERDGDFDIHYISPCQPRIKASTWATVALLNKDGYT